jgi:molecular chaperone GrpE
MSEFRAAGTGDEVLGSAVTQEQENAANGEPRIVRDGDAAREAPAPEEAVELPGGESSVVDGAAEDSRGDEYLALAQRTQADFENYRKRMARELDGAQSRGVARLARELVPTLDNLERALVAATEAPDVDEQLIEGLRLVHRELVAALERAGIQRYGEAGEGFDPALHEAVAHQPVDGAKSGSVVEVYQAGYRLGGAVIRPARVLVAA